MFSAGQLTAQQAALLNEMLKGYQTYGFRLSTTAWPLSVHRSGRLQGQTVGIDPKALNGPWFFAELTASGGAYTYTGSGGIDGDARSYSWVERVMIAPGLWADGERSGEFDAFAVEPEAGFTDTVADGTVVLMRKSPTVTGRYEFLPPPTAAGGGTIQDYDHLTLAAFDNTQATGVFSTNTSMTLAEAGLYRVSFMINLSVTATAAGNGVYAGLVVGGVNYRTTLFGTVQVAGVTVNASASGHYDIEVGAGTVLALRTARYFPSGSVTGTIFGGSDTNASALHWLKLS